VDRTAGDRRLVRAGAVTFGFGFGGLVDGIVLHQVLQWHNLVSDVTPSDTLDGLQDNVFWDGVFHAATASFVALGVVLLLLGGTGTGRSPGRVRRLCGLALVGWGAFHVVDQLAFHLLLGLHDIREAADRPELWNWGFFAVGLVLAGVGALLAREPAADRVR
jgi:uncharacterized membrane protein